MAQDFISLVKKEFKVTEKTLGEYAKIDKSGMHFRIHAYDVENIGSFCVMDMKAMLGLMKMKTVVFTPIHVDVPLFSYDGIQAMGNDTLILEMYDTNIRAWDTTRMMKVAEAGADLPDHDPGTHWYDSIKLPCSVSKKGKKMEAKYAPFVEQYMSAYIQELKSGEACSEEEKRDRTAKYVEGLLTNGGPAVNQFKKMLGEEKTAEFLRKYMFASQRA